MRLLLCVICTFVLALLAACSISDVLAFPSLQNSSIEVVPNSIRNDGLSYATVTVQVMRSATDPLPGAYVQIVGSHCDIVQTQHVTDSNGVLTATATSLLQGGATISANIQTPEYAGVLPQVASLTILGASTVTHFAVETSTTAVHAGDSVSLTVRALDADNNMVVSYTGELMSTSTDLQATLPQSVAFGPAGHGEINVMSELILRTAGSQTISVMDPVINAAGTSAIVTVKPQSASRLMFISSPNQTTTCSPMPSAVLVAVQDMFGNTVTDSQTAIDLSLQTNPLGVHMTGVLSTAVAAGIAPFDQVQFDATAQDYRWLAQDHAGTLIGSVSPPFTIVTSPPQVTAMQPAVSASGCIGIPYSVAQACAAPVSVKIEFSLDGNAYRVASASATSTWGNVNLPSTTAATGRAAVYVWDSTRDLPHQNTTASLRFTPNVDGTDGTSVVVHGVAVRNAVTFAAPQDSIVASISTCIAAAPFSQSGSIDLALCNTANSHIAVEIADRHGNFTLGSSAAAGSNPVVAVVGDINHDSYPDVATMSSNSNIVSLLINNGHGVFSSTLTAVFSVNPSALALADIDRDARLDVAIVSMTDGSLTWARQTSGGLFTAQQAIAICANPTGIVLQDVNRDGFVDAVVTCAQTNTLVVALGNGSAFNLAPTPSATGNGPTNPVTTDLNLDGLPDVILLNANDATLQSFLGDGTGQFAAPTAQSIGVTPLGLRIGDLDHDGNADAAVIGPGALLTFLGNGVGQFDIPTGYLAATDVSGLDIADVNQDGLLDILTVHDTIVSAYINSTPRRCSWGLQVGRLVAFPKAPGNGVAGDFNADGKIDVAVVALDPNVYISLGDGAGGLAAPTLLTTNANALQALVTADFDGDGNLDVAVTANDAALTVILNAGTSTYHPISTPLAVAASALRAADMTNDAIPDIVTILPSTSQVAVLTNDGNANFLQVGIASTVAPATALATGDLNADGFTDVVVTHAATAQLRVLFGDGAGHLVAGPTIRTATQPRAVEVGDMNVDGITDIVVGCYSGVIQTFLGDANATFGNPLETHTASITAMTLTDFNGDQVLDLLLGSNDDDTGVAAQGLSNGLFALTTLAFDTGPQQLLAADMDGDTHTDIISINTTAGTVGVLNNPSGFAVGISSAGTLNAQSGATADFNHDGILDAALVDADHSTMRFYLGDGSGVFSADQSLPVPLTPTVVTLGDLNRDGWEDFVTDRHSTNVGINISFYNPDVFQFEAAVNAGVFGLSGQTAIGDFDTNGSPDLAIPDCNNGSVDVALNDGTGAFASTMSVGIGNCPTHILAADADNNGTVDLVTSNAYDGQLSVIINDGAANFDQHQVMNIVTYNFFTVLDLNQDGKTDIIASTTGNQTYVAWGTGSGSYSSPQLILTHAIAALADINMDGYVDAISSPGGDALSVQLGDGAGAFAAPVSFGAGASVTHVLINDYDRNGLPDIAVVGAGIRVALGR